MATTLKTTDLDFPDIKNNLKNYLKQQTVFNDYDFDGAGLNILLDVLAYNTHYNAMAAHLALNEAFLDSAQIRGNAVARARQLGYVPRSSLSPRAKVTLVVDVSSSSESPLRSSLTLPRGTKFSTTVDGETFNFVTLDSTTVNRVDSGSSKTFTFTDVEIAEGTYNSIKYRVDNDISMQKHQIPHKACDTSTLRVRVQANEESTSYDIFTKFTTLVNVNASSKIYHLQENTSGNYEVYFGDGVTGTKPENNQIVTLDYVTTNGLDANGAKTFTVSSSAWIPAGGTIGTPTTTVTAAGGADQETLESIRYNAPLTYTSQNRAVTSEDYGSIIQREFSNIESLSTWGGEDQAIPDYGKVFVCIKPVTAATLTDAEKNQIKGSILKGKNVVSITPEIVDPNYSYLELDVSFKYNPNLTDRSASDLKTVVTDTLDDYSLDNLNKFDGVFRHSALLKAIDSADPAILNSTVRPFLFKSVTPSNTALNNFTLTYPGKFHVPGGTTYKDSCLTSTAWKLNAVDNYFADKAIADSTKRQIYAYKIVNQVAVTTIEDCGTVDPDTGIVILSGFTPDDTTAIRINATPLSLDIAPKRDELLSIDSTRTTLTAEEDTIAVSGSSGSIDYTTTSRFRT